MMRLKKGKLKSVIEDLCKAAIGIDPVNGFRTKTVNRSKKTCEKIVVL